MKLGFVYRFVCIVCVVSACSSSFAQKKSVVKQSFVEEVVYEYDTVFVEDVKQDILNFHILKPKSALLDVAKPKLFIPISVRPVNLQFSYPVNFFAALSVSAYSTFSISNNRTNGLSVKQNGSYFPAYSLTFGFEKHNFIYSLSAEYRQYSEVLQQTIPLSWNDTIDNGSEIYYRTIDGQLKTTIKNEYRFLQINSAMGYRFWASSFSISPQALVGVGFNLPQNNFYFDTFTQKIAVISSSNKAGTFLVLGASCPFMYHYNNSIAFLLKPEWQHFFIGSTIHPLEYRNVFGLNFGVVYSFSPHN